MGSPLGTLRGLVPEESRYGAERAGPVWRDEPMKGVFSVAMLLLQAAGAESAMAISKPAPGASPAPAAAAVSWSAMIPWIAGLAVVAILLGWWRSRSGGRK